jgi:acyl carrier protein
VAPEGDGAPTIGRAIRGVVAEVVDEQLRPVPPGMDGELVIGGVAVAPGYLGRPELTAERFVADEHGGRRYRTGDRVRQRENGEIEFLGRLDDQLSIRGFRVEPGEVAAALNAHPAVEAGVAVGSGAGAARQLVAYVVAVTPEPPEAAELDAFLAGVLPDYMVPSRYVWLDALPVTANGKVDRAALPDPAATTDSAAAGPPASSDLEARVAAIMAELLEVPVSEISSDQNFFLLGGHSMLGAQLIVRLERHFGAELSLRFLFDHPTPHLVAAEVERQVAEGAATG